MGKRSCHSCHHLRRYPEDFDFRYYSFDCNKHKQLANLRSFPFKNGCEGYDAITPSPEDASRDEHE